MRKLFNKRFVALLLTLAMVLSLVPMMAFAADDEGADDGLVMNKSVVVNDDGTYTINLEAYATGTVSTSTVTVPTDIVLVLDVSGSMNNCLVCGQSNSSTHTTYEYTPVYDLATDGTYYRDQNGNRAYYCSTCEEWRTRSCSTGIFGGHNARGNVITPKTSADSAGTQLYTRTSVTGNCVKRMDALEDAAQLFVGETATKNNTLIADGAANSDLHRISIVKFAGTKKTSVGNDTYTSGGYTYNNTQIVTELTAITSSNVESTKTTIENLAPAGATSADYGLQLANTVLNASSDDRAKVVILFTDGEPNHGNNFDEDVALDAIKAAKTLKDNKATVYSISVLEGSDPYDIESDMNKYMNAVSSNYPAATANSFDALDLSAITGGNSGYYKVASNASQLTSIFREISNSVGSPSVQLTAEAILKDIVASSFELPEGFTVSGNIKLETADYLGGGVFDTPVAATGVTATVNGNTVDVTGFDYSANYVVDGEGTVETSGKKLIVTISGVEVNEDNFATGQVDTNDAASGLYADGSQTTAIEYFEKPNVTLASKSYVVDYAKPFEVPVSEWGLDVAKHIGASASKFDPAKPGTDLDLTYGKVEKSNNGYTYTPETMEWDGADVFYAFGNKANDKLWSKVEVVPANNVYYEDSFAAIEYTGVGETAWEIVYNNNGSDGSSDNNTEIPEGIEDSVHGWIDSLSDDPMFSDGSAHVISEGGAKASFTFVGTGVDIYSYTDSNSGIVTAMLYDVENPDTPVFEKYMIVDNLAVSGAYYQIPTLSFDELDASKSYRVDLYVNNAKVLDENGEPVKNEDGSFQYRSTYYLDGIRVYNPLGAVTDDYTGVDQNTIFEEVRDLLADTTNNADTSDDKVFIDMDGQGNVGDKADYDASEYGTYGPKNEVYLAAGQKITFKVSDTTAAYYVGLKAPEGTATQATVSNGAENAVIDLAHSTDLYYSVKPTADGYVTIWNSGAKLLSVTKIQMVTSNTAASAVDLLSITEVDAAAEFAAFSLRASAPYAEDEVVEPETPETEPEVPEIDVEIDNPDPEPEPEPTPDPREGLRNLVRKLFGFIIGLL